MNKDALSKMLPIRTKYGPAAFRKIKKLYATVPHDKKAEFLKTIEEKI